MKTSVVTGTAVGAAGVGGAACTGLLTKGMLGDGSPPLPAMGEFLAELDAGMELIAGWSLSEELGAEPQSAEDELARKALRALHLSSKLGDLPETGQAHPGMQARLWAGMPEMNEAAFGMVDYLERVTPEQSAAVQDFLNGKGNPGMEVAAWLDEKERRIGVSTKRRVQTRSMLTQLVAELKSRPPAAVCGTYAGRMRKLAATGGTPSAVQRRTLARLGREEFFAKQERLARYAALWEEAGVTMDDVPATTTEFIGGDAGADQETDASVDAQANAGGDADAAVGTADASPIANEEGPTSGEAKTRGQIVTTTGAWMLGMGGVAAGASGIFMLIIAFTGAELLLFPGLTAATAGAVGILVGLVTLFVGLSIKAAERRQREAGEAGK